MFRHLEKLNSSSWNNNKKTFIITTETTSQENIEQFRETISFVPASFFLFGLHALAIVYALDQNLSVGKVR